MPRAEGPIAALLLPLAEPTADSNTTTNELTEAESTKISDLVQSILKETLVQSILKETKEPLVLGLGVGAVVLTKIFENLFFEFFIITVLITFIQLAINKKTSGNFLSSNDSDSSKKPWRVLKETGKAFAKVVWVYLAFLPVASLASGILGYLILMSIAALILGTTSHFMKQSGARFSSYFPPFEAEIGVIEEEYECTLML